MQMAKLFVLILTLAFIFITSNARNTPSSSFTNSSKSPTYACGSSTSGNFSSFVCDPKRYSNIGLDINNFSFCNSSLSYNIRVKDLIDQMTLNEKVQQLGDTAYGVPRLGIPLYEWWNEALHGVSGDHQEDCAETYFDSNVPGAISFPNVILTAATFNESLWKLLGQVVSTEARAMYNLGHAGLTFWSPSVNVVRDPRWGRTQETPGEDPFVVGKYASNYVRGLQDIEGFENYIDLYSRPIKVAACCKHYAAYDLDQWISTSRFTFDAKVHEQDMVETFLRPFEMCVKEGDVASVMCSFNKINGIPTCADSRVLRDTIRGEWKLHGYIVSDCDSIETMMDYQHWLNATHEEQVSLVLRAGLDLNCGFYYKNYTGNAVEQGKVSESDVDNALTNTYLTLMRVGFFDGHKQFESLGKGDICTEENIELATEASRQGIVLLKNLYETLPLNSINAKTIALVGPHANATSTMIGSHTGVPCQYTSPINGFSRYVEVKYAMGCLDVACKDQSYLQEAIEVARNADATIVFVGLSLSFEREGWDRMDFLLPGYQKDLIEGVSMESKGPVILVVMSGGGLDISFAKYNDKVQAILWVGYPGEEGGRAIADVIFGEYNPGGRLPVTWYQEDYIDMLPMTSMQLRPDDVLGYPGRTYKFFNGSTVYPFGFGLSYTQFNYTVKSSQRFANFRLNKTQHCRNLNYNDGTYKPACPAMRVDDLKCDVKVKFEIEVHNNGTRNGSEVILVYSKPPLQIIGAPIKQLVAFKRMFIKEGDKIKVKFRLNICKSLSIVEQNAYKLLPSGQSTIMIGEDLVSFPVEINFKSSLGLSK